jgi:cell cycle checkpoint control protein RAD9A
MLKTHRLTFIECDTLTAVFARDTCQNSVKAHVRLLCDAVNNFQQQQEEVTLVATGDSLTLKNYADDEPGKLFLYFALAAFVVLFAA